jgi:hypothetical protein
MEKLKEVLAGNGISRDTLDKMDAAGLRNLAKAFNINARELMPRNVRIETGKNGAQYVVTDGFTVPKFKDKAPVAGETSEARNLYVRVESIDQIIADLTAAKGLLKK